MKYIVTSTKIYSRSLLEKFVILEFLLCSGSTIYSLALSTITIPFFVLTSYCLFQIRKINLHKRNLHIATLLVVWVLVNHLFVNPGTISNMYLSVVFYAIGSLFAISSIRFDTFKYYLFRYFSALCCLSIVVWLLFILNILSGSWIPLKGGPYLMTLVFFNVQWTGRLSSIYWEPGQFQCVIMFVICLCTDYFIDYKKHKISISIILLALLLTFSTTGYLAFSVLMLGFIWTKKSGKNRLVRILLALTASLILFYFLFQSSAIQSKIEMRDNETNQNSSYYIRMNDMLGMFEITKKYPIWGAGMETPLYIKESESYNNLTASNAWLFVSSTNGVPLLIFVLFLLISGIRRIPKMCSNIFIIAALFLSQSGEYYPFFPLAFVYYYKFSG